MAASYQHHARPHIPEDVLSGDFDRYAPATSEDFERCNACRYPFQQRSGRIDMNDFRRHKGDCPRKP